MLFLGTTVQNKLTQISILFAGVLSAGKNHLLYYTVDIDCFLGLTYIWDVTNTFWMATLCAIPAELFLFKKSFNTICRNKVQKGHRMWWTSFTADWGFGKVLFHDYIPLFLYLPVYPSLSHFFTTHTELYTHTHTHSHTHVHTHTHWGL